MKSKWILGWGILVLLSFNTSVWKKERLLDGGRRVLLKLAPTDPRSLMQGDYMILDYEIRQNIPNEATQRGRFVLRDNEQGVAQLVRIDDGTNLSAQEYYLTYKVGKHRISLGAESFFFEEGQGPIFEEAVYGELVVDSKGKSILIGLRDKDLQALGKAIKE